MDSNGFTPTDTVQALPAYEKHAGYFNVDNGTGKIRGVYLQGNTQVKDAFSAWIAPLKDKGVTTVSPANTSGTDQQRERLLDRNLAKMVPLVVVDDPPRARNRPASAETVDLIVEGHLLLVQHGGPRHDLEGRTRLD